MMIRLEDVNGYPLLVNTDHIAFITPAVTQQQNGAGPRQLAIGQCAIVMANCSQAQPIPGIPGQACVASPTLIVKGSVEEFYKLLKPRNVALLGRDDA